MKIERKLLNIYRITTTSEPLYRWSLKFVIWQLLKALAEPLNQISKNIIGSTM